LPAYTPSLSPCHGSQIDEDDQVYCGPSGNRLINNKYGSLKEAKYQFSIGRPNKDVFVKEFDIAYKTLGKVQTVIASTQDRQHLLMGENKKVNNIRFSANIFEQCDVVSKLFDPIYPLLTELNSLSKFHLLKHPTSSDFLTPFTCHITITPLTDALGNSSPSDHTLEASGNCPSSS
jgi:hypothetical protein